ncbi:MAG: ParB/RepB/Spo0J family partition protein [Synergistales bacterium]|nr:ParB/RepB/Spo0J family partition protein [Synergistales bacterium]
MVKHRALGKGLGALIPGAEEKMEPPVAPKEKATPDENLTVPVSLLEPNPDQPRKDMKEETLQALAASLKEHGVVQPLIVREQGGKYQIVAGERRWRAAQIAGITEVPVRLYHGSDSDVMEVSLVENIQREDLAPLDVAVAIRQLLEQFSLTQEEIARKLGWSRTAVTNKLRLINLPEEIKYLLSNSLITEGHARTLLSLDSDYEKLRLARQTVYKMWSVRQLEQKVKEHKENRTTSVHPLTTTPPLPSYIENMAKEYGLTFRLAGQGDNLRLTIANLNEKGLTAFLDLIHSRIDELFPGKYPSE